MTEITMLIAAALGTLGFSLIYQVNVKHLPAATLGGVISCGVYIIFNALGTGPFVSNFVAMLVAAIVSEIFARLFRAPTAIFLLPCVIPLVPGGGLYYTMSNLISENYSRAADYGKSTLLTALGIAAGMIAASVIWSFVVHYSSKNKKDAKK